MKILILITLFPLVVFSAPNEKYTPTQLEWADIYFSINGLSWTGTCAYSFLVSESGVKALIFRNKDTKVDALAACKSLAKVKFDSFLLTHKSWAWLKYSIDIRKI